MARNLLHCRHQPDRHRQGELFPECGWAPDACQEGSGAAGLEIFQTEMNTMRSQYETPTLRSITRVQRIRNGCGQGNEARMADVLKLLLTAEFPLLLRMGFSELDPSSVIPNRPAGSCGDRLARPCR